MEEDELYDEFGNLLGDAQSGTSAELSDVEAETEVAVDEASSAVAIQDNYSTIIMQPYEQPLNLPVIQPIIERKLGIDYTSSLDNIDEETLPAVTYSREFMSSTMNLIPTRIRNIALAGNLHSGKTSFVDNLVSQTHITEERPKKAFKPIRYLDTHKLEVDRGITIKSSSISLLLQDQKERSHVLNIIDTPGHFNFADETSAALNGVEGVLLVMDVVEGLTSRDKSILSELIQKNKPVVVVLNKIDRLILELRLPVSDSYYKLKYIIDEVNSFIEANEYTSGYIHHTLFSPALGNVIFASSSLEFNFTLKSFSRLYLRNENIDIDEFSKRLWGDIYYDEKKNSFTADHIGKRSFEAFILEPLYKIITHTLTNSTDENNLAKLLWNNFGVKLKKEQYKQDMQILLKQVFKAVFVNSMGLVEAITSFVPSPVDTPSQLELSNASLSEESLLGHVIKLVESSDALKFYTLLRIYKGTLNVGSKVKVVGPNYMEDDEDHKIETVEEIFLPGGRYRVPIQHASAGAIVLVSGIDSIISKTATVFGPTAENITVLPAEKYYNKSVFKVAIEPANPSELPKLLAGLRKVSKSYLASVINVEESGEHVILGPGELYLDCALHDLRVFFTEDLEIRVSDPMTKFSETCIDTSITKITTKSTSGNNQLSIIAEPIEDAKLLNAIETGRIKISQPAKFTSKILRTEFGWDSLAARSIWYFGPEDMTSPSILVDDSLEGETDKKLLYSVKESICLGFKWSVNEGPLCGEPIRNTKFKILDAVISGSEIQRSNTQLIPLARRACYTGFLTASPRLMEPVYNVYVTATERSIRVLSKLLAGRRGYIQDQAPIPGTTLYEIVGVVPVIESFGLETDIRFHTQGNAMCFLEFSHWDIVPGDPLDTDCELPQLKPVPTDSLARDFVVKTRKRKGLTGEISLQKYIEGDLYEKLKESRIVR